MADQINTEVNEAEIINLWHRYRPIDDAPEAVAFARALLSASQPVAGQGVEVVTGTGLFERRPPCVVCSVPFHKHGSFPTCATHPYTADENCQHVIGARCVGAECRGGCVRARGVRAALSQPSAGTAGGATSLKAQEQIEDAVVAIMADTWSEFVADTGCFPSDFKIEPGRKLSFTPGSWAHWVGRFVAQRLASSPCTEGQRGSGQQEGGGDGR